MSDKISFGIVGCGMIANMHAQAIKHIQNAELVGVTDNCIQSAEKFAQQYCVKAYRDFAEMLVDKGVDAVCICTPSFLHADMAIQALEAGKHVVVEKPMALNEYDADKIISTCQKTGKKLTVVYQLRFEDDILKVKELVKNGAFGKITLCNLYMNYYRSKEYFSSSNWKGTIKYDGGGALMNQGIHGIDLLEYIMGDIVAVNGKARTLVHNIEVEDTAVATVEFKSGAMGVITASTCVYPGFNRKLEIYGESGYVVLNESSIEALMIDKKKMDVSRESELGCASDPTAINYGMHQKQLVNFIDAILVNAELVSDCFDGKKAIRVIGAIYKG